nr:uncharacterized protein RGD1559891 [Rattus norvegicus]|eukprot:XP_008758178.1 PREDICTED: uncharacterized protein RGD1559891 [Rattus norvegicus]
MYEKNSAQGTTGCLRRERPERECGRSCSLGVRAQTFAQEDMPYKGKKATSKTAKRPRESSDSQSDDDVVHHNFPPRPAEKHVIEISDEDSSSSDQDDQQARGSALKMTRELHGDPKKSHLAKRKQYCQDVKTSIDTLNEKLVRIFKTQQRERKMLRSKYSMMFEPLFQQWEKDVMKVGQEDDSFVNSSNQRAGTMYNAMMAQRATIDEAKTVSDQFLKNVQVLEDEHKVLDAIEQNKLENEMQSLKKKLETENQQQDLAAIESCLHFLFSEDNEED